MGTSFNFNVKNLKGSAILKWASEKNFNFA